MKFLKIIIILIIPMSIFSQKYDGICNDVSKLGIKIEKLSFTIYSDNSFIKERYQNIDEVKNENPEGLIKSQFSVKDNNWLSYNYNKKMVWTEDKFKKINAPNNYIELLCKLDIQINNENFTLLKINMYTGLGDPSSICIIMKKQGDKWYITDNKILSNLNFIFMFLSVDDLYCIFSNQLNSGNSKVNEIIKHLFFNNKFEFNVMIQKVGEILLNSDYQTKSFSKKNKNLKTIEIKISTNDTLFYSKQKYCRYFENKISNFSDNKLEVIMSFLNKKKELNQNNIFPLNSINYYDYYENDIFILKYKVINNGVEEIKNEYFKISDLKCEEIAPGLIETNIKKLFLNNSDFITKYFEIGSVSDVSVPR